MHRGNAARTILQVLLTIPISILSLLTALIVVGLIPIKFLVFVLAKKFRPDLDDFMGGLSKTLTFFPTFNVLNYIYIDGVMTVEEGRSCANDVLLTPEGKLQYKRMRQSWTNFCGYRFWREDPNFDLNNHVRKFDYKIGELDVSMGLNPNDASSLVSDLIAAPWKKDQSQWEQLYLPIFAEAPQTLLIFRFHHSLMDGFSGISFMKEMLKTEFHFKPAKYFNKRNSQLLPILRVPFDYAGLALDKFDFQKDWHFPPVRDTRDYHTVIVDSLSVQMVNVAKDHVGAPYAAVLLSALGGGLQRMFEEARLPVPEQLANMMPFPRPNHPGGCTNHMVISGIRWPIKANSAAERTREIQMKLNRISNPAFNSIIALMAVVVGELPNLVHSPLTTFFTLGSSANTSIFPVSTNECYAVDRPISCYAAVIGTVGQDIGTSIVVTGVNGKQRVVLTMDKRIFPFQSIFAKFGKYAEEELQSLMPSGNFTNNRETPVSSTTACLLNTESV